MWGPMQYKREIMGFHLPGTCIRRKENNAGLSVSGGLCCVRLDSGWDGALSALGAQLVGLGVLVCPVQSLVRQTSRSALDLHLLVLSKRNLTLSWDLLKLCSSGVF